MSWHGAWVLGSALLLCASTAQADQPTPQARAAAQALFDDARRLMSEGKPQEACPKLEESQRLDPGVGTQFNLAVCYESIGRTASAWSLFLEVAAAARSAAERAREQAARTRAATLEPKLSRLKIVVPQEARAPGLQIVRGAVSVGPGQWDVPLPTDPGTYTITASAPGKKPWKFEVTVPDDGETATLTLGPLPNAPAPAPTAKRDEDQSWFASLGTQRVVALGVGTGAVVAFGVGGVFGLLAINANEDSKSACSGGECTTDEAFQKREDARAHGDRATVAFIAGGALAATALVLYLTGAPEEQTERPLALAPAVAPGSAQLVATGRF